MNRPPGRRRNCAIVGTKGNHRFTPQVAEMAEAAGRLAAQAGFVVMTGGGSGTMEAAARGAVQAGGLVVGILPSGDFGWGNPWSTVVIPTSIGFARNVITAHAGDVMIALPGGWGTLQEITFAIELGRPVLSWQSHSFDETDDVPPDAGEDYVAGWLARQAAALSGP